MMKRLSVTAVSLMLTLSAFSSEAPMGAMTFFQGEMDSTVNVTFSEDDMESRSYSSKCQGNVFFNNENDLYSFGLASYNCRYGVENDSQIRFKAVDGQVYIANVWGEINEARGPVGTYDDGVVNVQFDRKRTVKVPVHTFDEEGCLAHDMNWEDQELASSLSFNFSYGEEGLAITRTETEQKVAPKTVRLGEGCHPHYYRKHIVVTKSNAITGTLK